MFSSIKKNSSIPLDKVIKAKNFSLKLLLAGCCLLFLFTAAYAVLFTSIGLKRGTGPRLPDNTVSAENSKQGAIERIFGGRATSEQEKESAENFVTGTRSVEKGGSIDSFKLSGTIITEKKKLAVFEDVQTRRQYVLREGEIMKDYRVILISRKSVELQMAKPALEKRASGKQEAGAPGIMEERAGTYIKQIGPHHYEIAKRVMLDHFKDPGKFLGEVRLIPHMADGKSSGFVLRNMQMNGFLSDIGFEEGDIVTKINGQSLNDTFAAIKNFASIGEMDSVFIELSRKNENIVLKYTIR